MNRYFDIAFEDLGLEAQDHLIKSIKEDLILSYKEETESGQFGKNFGRKEYQDMGWEEAFCRESAVDSIMWETEEEARKFDWKFAVEQYAEKQARNKCSEAFRYLKIDISL